MLQRTLNFSNHHVGRYLTGTRRTYPNAVAAYVDVRDVARAHLLAYEHEGPGAGGRYLCVGAVRHRARLVGMLRELFPQYPVTANGPSNMLDPFHPSDNDRISCSATTKLLHPFQIIVHLTFFTLNLTTHLIQKICTNITKRKIFLKILY